MPTYDYECRKCGHTFEKFQSMTEPRLKTCPKCRGKVERLIGTGAGIIFKGSGFYETDYKRGSSSAASSSSADSKAGAKSSTEKKSELSSSSSDSKTSKAGKGPSGA